MTRQRAIVSVLFMLLMSIGVLASAEATMTLPASVRVIEEEAFFGDSLIGKVVLPEGIEEIRARAFADSALTEIHLPDSLTFIDESAFDGTGDITVTANEGTYAYRWAVEHEYIDENPFKAQTLRLDIPATVEITAESQSAYFSFAPEKDGIYVFSSRSSDSDPFAFLYDAEMNEILVVDDTVYDSNFQLTYGLKAGEQYYFLVCDNEYWGASFEVCLSMLRVNNIQVGVPTAVEITEEDMMVYFSFVPETDGTYVFSSQSDDEDTYAYLYDSEKNELDDDEDSGIGWNFRIVHDLRAGEQYYFGVSAYESSSFVVCLSVLRTYNGIVFELSEDDTLTVMGYRGEDLEVIIPSEVDGYRVTAIADCAFYQWEELTSVVIPEDVTIIGDFAFHDCCSLTSITIPDGVTSIGHGAFSYCDELTSITIPDSVTSIGEDNFGQCDDLTIICSSGSYAQEYAVQNDISWIPMAVMAQVGSNTVHVNAGETVLLKFVPSETGTFVFESEGSQNTYGYLYDSAMNVFAGNDDDGIGSNFRILNNLTADTTYYVGVKFSNNTDSSDVALDIRKVIGGTCGTNVKWMLENETLTVFGTGDMADYGYFPDSPWRSYLSDSITEVVIENGVLSIGDFAFYKVMDGSYCNITGITISNSVTRIGKHAFDGCVYLTSITIPDSVTSIENDAFKNCLRALVIVCPSGSAAEQFALAHGYSCVNK